MVVSFFAGDRYYHDAALTLREDCERLGVRHDIVELSVEPGQDWARLCRRKVRFMRDMLRKHQAPVLWMDVDCRLLRPPPLPGDEADLGGFLRGFRYLRDTDLLSLSRLWQPSILLLNATPRTFAFLELMAQLEAQSDEAATDDYFLQEAWLQHTQQLSVLMLRPELVCEALPAPPQAMFLFGRSGQVSAYKAQVRQHEPQLYAPMRQKALFMHAGAQAGRTRRPHDALVLLRLAFELDRGDAALALRIARLLRRLGRMPEAIDTLAALPRAESDTLRCFLVDAALEDGQLDEAARQARELIATGSPRDARWARSRLLHIGLEARAQALGLEPAQRPALWWMETPYPGNFGDLLNPYVIEKLTGLPPRFVPKGKGILAIGSTIKFANEATTVWGAGTPRMTDRLDPRAQYRAVRGALTRRLVLESGGQCDEVYGDPAWFLPQLYQPAQRSRRYRLGLVCHHANAGELVAGDGVKSISVLRGNYEEIEQFIDEIHECECVLSTSLHGLIVCHAYGIPARWCEVPDATAGLPGDGTKFHDYLLSVGLEPEPPLLLPRGTTVTLDMVAQAQHLPRRQIDLHRLAQVAPFTIRPGLLD